MIIYTKMSINDETIEKVKTIISEHMPIKADALTDGMIIPIDLDDIIDQLGIPVEVFLPILMMVVNMINKPAKDFSTDGVPPPSAKMVSPNELAGMFFIRNTSNGKYLKNKGFEENGYYWDFGRKFACLYPKDHAVQVIQQIRKLHIEFDFEMEEFFTA